MASVQTPPSAAQQAAAMRAQNAAARAYITQQCPEFEQSIFSNTIAAAGAAQGVVVNVAPRNVGILTGFTVRVDVDVVTPAGVTLARTPYGASNLLSKVEFIDLANLTRLSTTGWHLALVNAQRFRRIPGAAYVSDTPLGFGNNNGSQLGIVCPATVAAATTQRVSMVYDVPVAYSKDDLRGAIFAAVVNANMSLNLTLNPALVSTSADATNSMYAASGAGTLVQNAKVTVYQRYYDQLPVAQNGGPALPFDDLSTSYILNQTTLTGLAVGQDFPIPYTNFRQFLSTSLVYDNGGTLNATNDVNYIALQTANQTFAFKLEPWLLNYKTRNMVHDDLPLGSFIIDHRRRPIDTGMYGNMSLLLNPNVVNAGAQVYVGWEYFTRQGLLNATGSLPAG